MSEPSSARAGIGAGGHGRLPLPSNFFPPIKCNTKQSDVLRHEADSLMREMVRTVRWEMHREDGEAGGWKLASSKKHFRETGLRTYCRKGDFIMDRKSRRMDFKCMGTIHMPMYQIMDALYSDNTVDFRSNTAFLLDGCLDSAVLHVLQRKSASNPHQYLGINWMAMRSPGLFGKKRDACYLRSTGTTYDTFSDEIGYLVMRSIEVNECPSLESSHGLVRLSLSAIMLFKERRDGKSTSVIWQGTMPLAGFSSSKMLEFVHTTFTSCVTSLQMFNVSRLATRETEMDLSMGAPREERKNCFLCQKKFSLLRTRHTCLACGKSMCRDCEVRRKTSNLERETFDGHASLADKENVRRFCKKCYDTSQRQTIENNEDCSYDFSQSAPITLDFGPLSPAMHTPGGRISTVSAGASPCSVQLTWPDLSQSTVTATTTATSASSSSSVSGNDLRRTSFSASVPLSIHSSQQRKTSMSGSGVPESPLSIKTAHTRRQMEKRDRLETDPWEDYDNFDEPGSIGPENIHANGNRGSTYSDGKDVDLAARLWEISCKAQETLDATKRNSSIFSESGSASRNSEHRFQNLDKNISEQADLLNVIGFVSTGRVYMENENGVRMSQSSIDDDDRFEVLID